MESDLQWLPERTDWHQALAAAKAFQPQEIAQSLRELRALACTRMDLALTAKLDRAAQRALGRAGERTRKLAGWTSVRLALLGSSTLSHLVQGIRVAGLRRGLLIEIYQAPYGTWRQELADPSSGLATFRPEVLLLALDARHLAELERTGGTGAALNTIREAWQTARERFGCAILQQTVMPVFPSLLGNAEHLLAESPAALVERLNADLPQASAQAGVHLLALHRIATQQGITRWHSPALWYRAKQEVHPAMSPVYGEHVARMIAALLGRTAKCLVLDLDHTLWSGVIGDEGLEGIVLGQGSAAGEAHLELQRYALALRARGVVLAVCSKNDEANARLPFEQHPEMLLRREHFACFVANWEDKAANLRRIARELNLGLDALVFVDDNPAERALIRRELPEVHVPELPPDPAEYVPVLASAGYFESLGITAEDRQRADLYARTPHRNVLRTVAQAEGKTSLESYLASLHMELEARPFDARGRARTVQLINKTNQFNLTTRRVLESEVRRLEADPDAITLQLRLRDLYGDQGMIAIAVAQPAKHAASLLNEIFPEAPPRLAPDDLLITHWLMSCRVFGRKVEDATLNLLAEQARSHGARRLLGLYLPTTKNGIVRDLFRRLGFRPALSIPDTGCLWALNLSEHQPLKTHITVHSEALALQPLR